jgi:hypothetical protein
MGFELKLIMPYLYFFSIDLSLFGSVKGDLTKDGIGRHVSKTKKRSQIFFFYAIYRIVVGLLFKK